MSEHPNPVCGRLVCLAAVLPKARRKSGRPHSIPSLSARHRGFRRCVEWGSRPC
ncbi:MAG: hypothetical protein O9341_14415 [Paucibacter sp.]|nr:hypothetical protein [Roseateles sp.]